ncbi:MULTISPECIES: DeoR/GlpR family DNA-binding transcription regulator [Cohaesibacter]|uniref:DeoR/GlpR family DNA-binding transcription regulator n=1 Tax=Cohaesibacter TaxID=655352 RepID=UPI000DEC0222|nr:MULTISPECIES: DeoR/GlpR family DNA-binding transcription regulator [Cohaesibacter]TLP44989.1 DeoR/GlpR transcriptional regulator [Cohaesibacter sp. CAU 1516]
MKQYSDRQLQIIKTVTESGFSAIEALSEHFSVSTQTIRRDVNALCEHGELRRVWGGVEPPPVSGNLLYAKRRILNVRAKRQIAAEVARHIPDGSSIALSIGTTPEMVIEALQERANLKIFTNNLNVAMQASARHDWSVTIAGGQVRAGDRDILGSEVEAFFDRFEVDFGIFGVAGVSPDGGLLDFSEAEVGARRAILKNCRTSVLVMDHSKLGRAAHMRGGNLSEVDCLFCDKPLPDHFAASLGSARVIIAPAFESDGADLGNTPREGTSQ